MARPRSETRWLKNKLLQHLAICQGCQVEVHEHFMELSRETLRNGSDLPLFKAAEKAKRRELQRANLNGNEGLEELPVAANEATDDRGQPIVGRFPAGTVMPIRE